MIVKELFETFFLYSFLFCFSIFLCIYLYFKYSYTYWARKNVPYLKPTFPLGNNDCISGNAITYGTETAGWYNEFKKRGVKIGGAYSWAKPVITLMDPEYIKDVLIKDFPIFVNREFFQNSKHDPEGESLFVVKGEEWKNTRQKISPYFTSSKLKMMFDGVVKNTETLIGELNKIANTEEEIDIKDYLYDYTMDNIGSLFLGVECNCLTDKNSKFRMSGRKGISIPFYLKPAVIFARIAENVAKFLGIVTFPPDITELFSSVVRQNIEYRKKNNIVHKDYLQLLVNYHESDEGQKNGFNVDKLVANEVLIFFAGFDTSATTTAFALYELSQQPALLERARNEVKTVLKKYDGKLTFEALAEMTYLKQVFDETLRLYPVLSAITRISTQPYTFANTKITIPTDTTVVIPLMGLGRDPEYFPNPELFDPDRFSNENKHNIKSCTFLPFGSGPRNCVGARFGTNQALAGLALILYNFNITSQPRICSPVELKKGTFVSESTEPLMLKLYKD